MAGRRICDDSFMHTMDTGNSHLQLINMMEQHSMDAEHKHILLENHLFLESIHNIPVMPFVTKVSFMDSIIKNGSILRFKQWCPNVAELTFFRTRFSRSVYQDFASTMLDDDDIMPSVKTLTFHFKNSFSEFGYFPEEMHEKFPSLEEFKLILDTMDHECDFEPRWNVDAPYRLTYFQNLRKFSLATLCTIDETDRIFENMNICNSKLEKLSCFGVHMSRDNIHWISSCRRLSELTLNCDFLDGDDLSELKGMESLSQFKLTVEKIEWDAIKIVEFVQSNQQLIRISIVCGQESKKIEFDDNFKMACDQLTRDRSELSIKFAFNTCHETQLIMITKDGFVETHVPRVDGDSDDNESSIDENDTDIDEETTTSEKSGIASYDEDEYDDQEPETDSNAGKNE